MANQLKAGNGNLVTSIHIVLMLEMMKAGDFALESKQSGMEN